MKFARLIALILFASRTGSTAAHEPVSPRISLEVNDGFCADGSLYKLVPSPDDPPNLNVWGGFCHAEYKTSALAKTTAFIAPKILRIYTIGWTKSPTLSLERISDGMKFVIVPWDEDLYRWSRSDFALPDDWQGKPVRLVAEGAPPRGLWRAFSEPVHADGVVKLGDAKRILYLTALHYAGLMMFALAVTAVGVYYGIRDRIDAGLITLAATALPGYCMFWLTLITPKLSHAYALTFLIGGLAALVVFFRKLNADGRGVLKSLAVPLLLTGAVALMVLSAGFLYGGVNDPMNKARGRFLPRLPPDNELPLLLAKGVLLPHVPSPLQGDWLSSDRPPLQSGMVLAEYPLFRRILEQEYTAASVLAQSLWIFGLWLLLSAFHLRPRAIALILAACLFSGFAFLNTLFVWPKMLAAAYTLGFLASFVSKPRQDSSRLFIWCVPAVLLAFSLLAHGGAVFALLPAVPLLLLWRRPTPWKRMVAVLLLSLLFYAPWMLYQKFYDPPGNHLLKMHLAGVEQLDKRTFTQTLKDAYGALSWDQIIANKKQNFDFAFTEGFLGLKRTALLLKALAPPANVREAAARGLQLREHMFFHPAACLQLFILAPWALLAGIFKRFRSIEWQTACVFWIFTFVSMSVWCLLMFGPSTTSIHQGAYATMLLSMAAGVLSFWAISPRLSLAVVVFQAGVNFLINDPLTRVPYPNGFLPEGFVHKDTLVLLCLSLTAVFWLISILAKEDNATPSTQS